MVNDKTHFLIECAGGQKGLARRMVLKGYDISQRSISYWYTETQHHPQIFYIPVLVEISDDLGLKYASTDFMDN